MSHCPLTRTGIAQHAILSLAKSPQMNTSAPLIPGLLPHRSMRFLRFFRPEIERAIKLGAIIALGTAYFTTLAWGYEWRRQARSWRDVACEHELKLIAQTTPLIAEGLGRGDACGTLDRLGLARHDGNPGGGRFAAEDSRAPGDIRVSGRGRAAAGETPSGGRG